MMNAFYFRAKARQKSYPLKISATHRWAVADRALLRMHEGPEVDDDFAHAFIS